jgi:hypothetical protein
MMPTSLVAPAILFLSAITASYSRAEVFDYNSLLNKGLDQNIFPRLGQYAVRNTVSLDSPLPPLGCVVTVVDSLERHGARLFTDSALASANASFVKIQASLSGVDASKLPAELQFLKNATLLGGTNSLVPYGALQYVHPQRERRENGKESLT